MDPLDPGAPDIDFSDQDGLGETRYVYLEGNDLPGAWAGRSRFVVSELGFGPGLNFLALATLAEAQRQAGASVPDLVYQSTEWAPRPPGAAEALGRRWPELAPAAARLEASGPLEPGWNRRLWPGLELRLWVGDARALPAAEGPWESADCWFLDGYAPDRGGELWEPELLAWVGARTRPGGTASTYSAAGVVKAGLRQAGFVVKRWPGWGPKRHMIRAQRLVEASDF